MHQHGESPVAGRAVEIGAEDDAIAHGDGDGGVDADGRLGDKRARRADRGEAGGEDGSVAHEEGMLGWLAAEIYCSRETTGLDVVRRVHDPRHRLGSDVLHRGAGSAVSAASSALAFSTAGRSGASHARQRAVNREYSRAAADRLPSRCWISARRRCSGAR